MIYKGPNTYSGMKLNDVFTGGKHKGYTLKHVIDKYISYMDWCRNNLPSLKIDKEAVSYYISRKHNSGAPQVSQPAIQRVTIMDRRKLIAEIRAKYE